MAFSKTEDNKLQFNWFKGKTNRPKFNNILSKQEYANVLTEYGIYSKTGSDDSALNDFVDTQKKASNGFSEFTESARKNGETINETTHSYQSYVQYCGEVNQQQQKLGITSKLASVGMSALSMAGNALVGMAISFVLSEVISQIYELVHANEIAIENGEKAKNTITETMDEYNSKVTSLNSLGEKFVDDPKTIETTGDALDSVAKKYTELSKGVNSLNNENVSLSDENYQSFLDISNQLAEVFPSLVSSYDANGNAILNLGNNASEASAKLRELFESQKLIAHADVAENIQTEYEGVVAKDKEYQKNIDEYNAKLKDLKSQRKLSDSTVDLESGYLSFSNQQGTYTNEAVKNIRELFRQYGIYTEEGVSNDMLNYTFTFNPDVSELDSKDIKNLKSKINAELEKINASYDTEIASTEKKKAAEKLKQQNNWKDLVPDITSYLQTDSSFSKANNTLQDAIIGQLGDLDTSKIKTNYGNNIEDFLYGEIIQPIDEMSSESQSALAKIFELDQNNLPFEKYRNAVDRLLTSAFGKDSEKKNHWTNLLGLNTIQEQFKEQFDVVSESLSGNKYQLNGLSSSDMQIAYDLVVNDEFSGTFEELQKKIKETKAEMNDRSWDITDIIQEENSTYKAAEEASKSANKGDTYDSMYKLANSAKSLRKSGDTGTDDFKTFAAMISPTGATDTTNYDENIAKFNRYFTEDNSGIINFLEDLQKKGLATSKTLSDGTKEWSYNIDDLEQAARKMGMGFEPFMAIFGELEDKGFHNDFFSTQEEGMNHLTDLSGELYQAEQDLQNLYNNDPGNSTAIEAKKKEIEELKGRIQDTSDALEEMLNKTPEQRKQEAEENKKLLQSNIDLYNKNKDQYQKSEEGKAALKQWQDQIYTLGQNAGFDNIGFDVEGNLILDTTSAEQSINETKEYVEKNGIKIEYDPDVKGAKEKAEKLIDDLSSGKGAIIKTDVDTSNVDEKVSEKTSQDSVITFSANVDGVSKEIKSVQDEEGNITYQTTIDGVDTVLSPILHKDGTVTYTANTDGLPIEFPSLEQTVNRTPDDSGISNPLPTIDQTAKRTPDNTGIRTAPTIFQKVVRFFSNNSSKDNNGTGGGGTDFLEGTAYLGGTAYANGYLKENKFPEEWKTNKEYKGALTGELGQEIVVYKNRWWTVGDNGAEFTNIPQGAIVFNHEQTNELFKKGYINSRGKAYLSGTAFNGRGTGGGTTGGNTGTSSTSSDDDSDSKKKTKKKTDKTKSALEKFQEAVGKFFDWIEIRLDRLERRTDKYMTKAENATSLTTANKYTNKAIIATRDEQSANSKAATRYNKQAEKVASLAVSNKVVDKKTMNNIKKNVASGKINISEYSDKVQEVIKNYQTWYEKAEDCKNAVEELKQQEKELYQQRLDNIEDYYGIKDDLYSKRISKAEALIDLLEKQGKNVTKDSVKGAFGSKTSVYGYQESALKTQVANAQKTYEAYFAEYNKQVKAGKLTGKDKEDALATVNELHQAWIEAKSDYEDYKDALRELDYKPLEQAIESIQNALDKLQARNDLAEKRGNKKYNNIRLTESSVQEEIGLNNDQIKKLYEKRQMKLKDMAKWEQGSTKWQEAKNEVDELDSSILQLLSDNEDAVESIRKIRWDAWEKGIETIDYTISELQDLQGLLNDNDFVSKSGGLTKDGYANIALYGEMIGTQQKKISEYRKALEKLQEEYNNNNISLDELTEQSREYMDAIRDSVGEIENYKESLLDMYTEMLEKQNEVLDENIEKRKDALEKMKDYHDYQKTINTKSKDINSLKAQIAALEGVSNQTSKAKLAQLKADLAEKEDDLAETKYDHEYEMRITGFDKMQEDADEALENILDNLERNTSEQQRIIDEMLGTIKEHYSDAYDTINNKINETGLITSQNTQSMINQLSSTGVAVSDLSLEYDKLAESITKAASIDTSTILKSDSGVNNAEKGVTSNSILPSKQTTTSSNSSSSSTSTSGTTTKKPSLPTHLPGATDLIVKVASSTKPKVSDIKHTLQEGMSGSAVKTLQKGLNATMKSGLTVDGKFGSKTKSALKAFQKKYKLTQNGVLDSKTKTKFRSLGYARGTRRVPEDGIYPTQELGSEIIYHNGMMLTPLSKEDMVFSHEMSDNLWKIAQHTPETMAKKWADELIGAIPPVNVQSGGQVVNNYYSYDSVLRIDGNTSAVTKDELTDFAEKFKEINYEYTSKKMFNGAIKGGAKRRI